jgi:hypothetical protein
MQRPKPSLRAFFFLFLLTCLLTGLVGTVRDPAHAAPFFVPSTSIVISQVYGGGGNAGATYLNDYIELYNLSNTTVSLNGWSIQYAGATGTTWQVTNLSGSLAAGQYYLIQLASGGGTGVALPTPDITGAIPMAATAGKVALVNTTIALTGSGCPLAASVIDFIGYGTTANCNETANAPAPSATNADLRNANGCMDTDNNSIDFTTVSPTPRNSSSIGYICGVGTYTPTSTSTNTNTPTNTFTPTSTFTPSNTSIFSLTPSLTSVPGEVIISEVAWMGTGASPNHEWIELYNTRSTPLDLTGWQLANSTASVDIILNGVIPANGFYLLERSQDLTVSDVVANQIYSGALGDANDYLILSLGSGTVIDTANNNGSAWPAGTGSPNFNSMERVITGGVPAPDGDAGWVSNTNSATWTKHDARGTSASFLIHGTPGYANWAFTVTVTATPTVTFTLTRTLTPTITTTALPTATTVVISEFRTVGPNGGNDEFIELFNPTGSAIAIGGWTLRRSTGCGTTTALMATIPASVALAAGQHYLIVGGNYSGSVSADLSANLGIANDGGVALLNSGGTIIDQVGLCSTTTYKEGTALTSLTTNVNRGYDRKASSSGACVDSNNNAVDFFLRSPSDPQNSASPLTRCGNVTPTPTITPTGQRTNTPRPTATPTPTLPPPPPLIAINEFVPRAGHDWNNDGVVNVGDEYIELLNHGVIPVTLTGYALDDESSLNSSPPFSLPAVTLQPGQRIVFYGSQTGLLLSDGGDDVRLLKPGGAIGDAYNYTVVRYPDQSFCRLPDNGGLDDWNQNCFPTPGLKNALGSGGFNPPVSGEADPLCPIADTMPIEFILAECPSFGNIWSRYFWDKKGWFGEMIIPNVDSQWDVFVD